MSNRIPLASGSPEAEGNPVPPFMAPVYPGSYRIGGVRGLSIALPERPSWWHRFWMRTCLGIEWVDDGTVAYHMRKRHFWRPRRADP